MPASRAGGRGGRTGRVGQADRRVALPGVAARWLRPPRLSVHSRGFGACREDGQSWGSGLSPVPPQLRRPHGIASQQRRNGQNRTRRYSPDQRGGPRPEHAGQRGERIVISRYSVDETAGPALPAGLIPPEVPPASPGSRHSCTRAEVGTDARCQVPHRDGQKACQLWWRPGEIGASDVGWLFAGARCLPR